MLDDKDYGSTERTWGSQVSGWRGSLQFQRGPALLTSFQRGQLSNERKRVKSGDKRQSVKAALDGRGTVHLITGVKAWCVVQTLLGDGCECGNLWTFFSHCFNLLSEMGDKIIS